MLKESPLCNPMGNPTIYSENYSPDLLFPIPRSLARDKTGISLPLLFTGVDYWNGYELSWLNPKGKPEIAMAEFQFPCTSLNVIESKSFKLYLNSFNQSSFSSLAQVQQTMQRDLSQAAEAEVKVKLYYPSLKSQQMLEELPGFCLDGLDIETSRYTVDPQFLMPLVDNSGLKVEETLYTNLLKSNCLATGQPDWGSVLIHYIGPLIDHENLLKYVISFRKHAGFAEHCIEQIFHDILSYCHPDKLTVYGCYTRRGGLDINPFRSNFEQATQYSRQFRQ